MTEIASYHLYRVGEDPAGYLVDPGGIDNPGHLRHARPYLLSGKDYFLFPVGVEGFSRDGTALLALHRPIGYNATIGQTLNTEEARISLNGTFPGGPGGADAQQAMVDCINILRSQPPDPGLILVAAGVFLREQYVLPENWNFTHDPEDRTHSISYTITFVRIGEGDAAKDKAGTPPRANPGVSTGNYGQPTKVFTVQDGVRTLRAIAGIVYGNADQWAKLVTYNQGSLALFQRSAALNIAHGLPSYQLPTYRWPLGTKFRYE